MQYTHKKTGGDYTLVGRAHYTGRDLTEEDGVAITVDVPRHRAVPADAAQAMGATGDPVTLKSSVKHGATLTVYADASGQMFARTRRDFDEAFTPTLPGSYLLTATQDGDTSILTLRFSDKIAPTVRLLGSMEIGIWAADRDERIALEHPAVAAHVRRIVGSFDAHFQAAQASGPIEHAL